MKDKLILEELKQLLNKKDKKERMIAAALAGAIALTPGIASADDEDSTSSVGTKTYSYETMVKGVAIEAPKVLEVYSFKDVPNTHWAYNSVTALQGAGAIEEIPTGLFLPNNKITREEFVLLLMKTLNLKSSTPVGSYQYEHLNNLGLIEVRFSLGKFWDLCSRVDNHPYIAKAVENNVISGISEHYFNPEGLLTREQAATIMHNALKAYYKGTITSKPLSFNDNAKISSWAKSGVEAMVGMGIFKGKEGNLFDPKGNLTNAETAAVVVKVAQLVKNAELGLPKVAGQYKSVEERLKAAGAIYGNWKTDPSRVYIASKFKTDGTTLRISQVSNTAMTVASPLKGTEEWSPWITYYSEAYADAWREFYPYDNISFEDAVAKGIVKAEFRDIYSDFFETQVTEVRYKENLENKPRWNEYMYEKREILNLNEVLKKDPSLKDDISYLKDYINNDKKTLSNNFNEKDSKSLVKITDIKEYL